MKPVIELKAENYWLVEIYSDETVNVSVTSKAEIEAREDELEDWQYRPTSEVDEEDMIEKAEEKGYEHDPW